LLCVLCDRECNESRPHMDFQIQPEKADPVKTKTICCACLARLGLYISRWRHDGTWDRVLLGAGVKSRIVKPRGVL